MNILNNCQIKYNYVLVFRGIVTQNECEKITRDMESFVLSKRVQRVDGTITATHEIYDEKADFEIIMPIDREIEDIESNTFKLVKNFKIENCVMINCDGNLENVEEQIDRLYKYIEENNLKIGSPGYTFVKLNMDGGVEIEYYVSVT